MKLKITTKQIMSLNTLIKNIKTFNDKKYGTIYDLKIMSNSLMPNTILVKYNKSYSLANELRDEFIVTAVKQDGSVDTIQNKFADVFEQASFLSTCIPFDIDNMNQYDKID